MCKMENQLASTMHPFVSCERLIEEFVRAATFYLRLSNQSKKESAQKRKERRGLDEYTTGTGFNLSYQVLW